MPNSTTGSSAKFRTESESSPRGGERIEGLFNLIMNIEIFSILNLIMAYVFVENTMALAFRIVLINLIMAYVFVENTMAEPVGVTVISWGIELETRTTP